MYILMHLLIRQSLLCVVNPSMQYAVFFGHSVPKYVPNVFFTCAFNKSMFANMFPKNVSLSIRVLILLMEEILHHQKDG